MNAVRTASLIAVAFAALTGVAHAADPTPVIDQRAARQEARIAQGVASGSLTNREAARLERREARLQGDIAAAKADGVVTGAERRALRREENRDSRAIARQKHDAQHR